MEIDLLLLGHLYVGIIEWESTHIILDWPLAQLALLDCGRDELPGLLIFLRGLVKSFV